MGGHSENRGEVRILFWGEVVFSVHVLVCLSVMVRLVIIFIFMQLTFAHRWHT